MSSLNATWFDFVPQLLSFVAKEKHHDGRKSCNWHWWSNEALLAWIESQQCIGWGTLYGLWFIFNTKRDSRWSNHVLREELITNVPLAFYGDIVCKCLHQVATPDIGTASCETIIKKLTAWWAVSKLDVQTLAISMVLCRTVSVIQISQSTKDEPHSSFLPFWNVMHEITTELLHPISDFVKGSSPLPTGHQTSIIVGSKNTVQ